MVALLVDLSRVFDIQNFEILSLMLKAYKIRATSLELMNSYMP